MNIVIFSKDRALQLELLLRSMKQFFRESIVYKPSIIYKASTPDFQKGYDKLKEIHTEFNYIPETNFRDNVLACLSDYSKNYTVFFVDDNVFVAPFSPMDREFHHWTERLNISTLSLRMHPGVTYCYTANIQTPSPVPLISDPFTWYYPTCKGDWGYMCSLDGHVFRSHEIRPLINRVRFSNPNSLEDAIATYPWGSYMCCYQTPRILNIAANRVQTYNNNRNMGVSVEALNSEFLNGKRIALEPLLSIRANAPHCEAPYTLEPLC